MTQAIKTGFSISVFPTANYRVFMFISPHCSSIRMTSKRLRSNSRAPTAENSNEATRVDVHKLENGASEDCTGKSGILEDELDIIDKMTVQQLKARLRTIGLPVKGVKHELVCILKSFMNNYTDGNGKAKTSIVSISESDQVENSNVSDSSGNKRTKMQAKPASTNDGKSNQGKMKISARTKKAFSNVDVAVDEPWTILTHKKPQKGWAAYDPLNMRPPPIDADTPHMKLVSWNVNGLRALLKLEGFSAVELARRENFDVLCLQETKLQEKDVDAIRNSLLEDYDNSYWTCSVSKLGYSGTSIISRIKPHSVRYGLGIVDHDNEGRLVTVEFDDFYLLSAYVPNAGDGLKRLSYRIAEWDPSLSNYMKELEKSKPVILTGDLNCAHQEIDIYNPAGNKRSAGFTDEERKSFHTNFLDRGFVDTFRKQHPNAVGYTYWGYRHCGRKTNKGWRLDYFLASESIAGRVHDSYILPDVGGSDHSPIGLVLKL